MRSVVSVSRPFVAVGRRKLVPTEISELKEGHQACKKTEWWGAGVVVICLERGADLHVADAGRYS